MVGQCGGECFLIERENTVMARERGIEGEKEAVKDRKALERGDGIRRNRERGGVVKSREGR